MAGLQAADEEIARGNARLAQVEKQLSDHADLDKALSEAERARREAHRLAAEQRDLELQVEEVAAKIKLMERKLYGGAVQNPKELNDLAKDVEQLRRQRAVREDRLLECLEREESANRVVQESGAALQQLTRRHESEQQSLGSESEALRARLAELASARERLRSSSQNDDVRLYDSLRKTRGLAVAEVRQRTCQACRVGLTQHDDMRARSGDALITCQSCGRLLYAAP